MLFVYSHLLFKCQVFKSSSSWKVFSSSRKVFSSSWKVFLQVGRSFFKLEGLFFKLEGLFFNSSDRHEIFSFLLVFFFFLDLLYPFLFSSPVQTLGHMLCVSPAGNFASTVLTSKVTCGLSSFQLQLILTKYISHQVLLCICERKTSVAAHSLLNRELIRNTCKRLLTYNVIQHIM